MCGLGLPSKVRQFISVPELFLCAFTKPHIQSVDYLGFSRETIILFANKYSAVFSFHICIPLISFSGLIALHRTSGSLLKRNGEM